MTTWTISQEQMNEAAKGEHVTIRDVAAGKTRTGYVDSIRPDGTYLIRTRTALLDARPERTMLQARRARDAAKVDATLAEIASKHLSLQTLETRSSDSLDFSDQSVWGIKAALEAAYAAGKRDGQGR